MKYLNYFPIFEATVINKELDDSIRELSKLLNISKSMGCASVKGGEYSDYAKESIGKLKRKYGKTNDKANKLISDLVDASKKVIDAEKKYDEIFDDHAQDISEIFQNIVGDEMSLRKVDHDDFLDNDDDKIESKDDLNIYNIWTSPEYCNIYLEFTGIDYGKYSKLVEEFLNRIEKIGYNVEGHPKVSDGNPGPLIKFYDKDFEFMKPTTISEIKNHYFSYNYTGNMFIMSINIVIKL